MGRRKPSDLVCILTFFFSEFDTQLLIGDSGRAMSERFMWMVESNLSPTNFGDGDEFLNSTDLLGQGKDEVPRGF